MTKKFMLRDEIKIAALSAAIRLLVAVVVKRPASYRAC